MYYFNNIQNSRYVLKLAYRCLSLGGSVLDFPSMADVEAFWKAENFSNFKG